MSNENNFAFIDANNLHKGIERHLNWDLSYRKFREYLENKYDVKKAFYFIGYVKKHEDIYRNREKEGYIVEFRPTLKTEDGIKGNCDTDLVFKAMKEKENYDKAVIVTSDGDFYRLIEHLRKENKLKAVISPAVSDSSVLLRKRAKSKMRFIKEGGLKEKLLYKK